MLGSRLLWLALVLCAPLPFFLVEVGREPLPALLAMLGVVLRLIAAEGSAGAIGLMALMLAAQALLGALAWSLVSVALGRLAARLLGARSAGIVLVAVAAAVVLVAATRPIYRTPFRTAGLSATLFEVFE